MTKLYAQSHHIINDHIWRELDRLNNKGTRRKTARVRDIFKRIAYDISHNVAYSDTAKLYIGTDSQSIKRKKRAYGSSIVLEGADTRKVLYTKRHQYDTLPIKERLIHELDYSIQLWEGLIESSIQKTLAARSIPCSIHVDINPDPQFASNQAYANALYRSEQLLERTSKNSPDIDLTIRFKPHAVYATKIGDRICKGGL